MTYFVLMIFLPNIIQLDLFALTSYVIETASSRFMSAGCRLITSAQEYQLRASSHSMTGFVPR
jgi:hypothetical protein